MEDIKITTFLLGEISRLTLENNELKKKISTSSDVKTTTMTATNSTLLNPNLDNRSDIIKRQKIGKHYVNDCVCGVSYVSRNRGRHLKSKAHKEYVSLPK